MCVAVVQVWGVGVLVFHSLVRVDVRMRAESSFVCVLVLQVIMIVSVVVVQVIMNVVMVQVVVLVDVVVGYFFVEMGVAVLFGNC